VNAAGTIIVEMNFTDTYGRFYYGYVDTLRGSGCVTSSFPVYMCTGLPTKFGCAGAYTAKVIVPAQTITFSLTAVSSNNPPTAPVITGVTSANLGTTNTFTFNATDPDGDTIRYQIDWNNDGTVDGLSPTSLYVPSGSNSTSNYTLPSTGTSFTFKARTEDSKGGVSGWTTYTVTLLQAVNGTCGPADGVTLQSAPTIGLCIDGTASSITTNPTTWTWTCSGTNGGNVSPTCTTTKQGPMVNLWFSWLDRVKLFTTDIVSSVKLVDRVNAYDAN
jgi:hypothetical protein